jgi:hypothetical protein
MNDSTVRYIALLTRVHDVEEELAHKIRVSAHSGNMTDEEAQQIITRLKKLPGREGSSNERRRQAAR